MKTLCDVECTETARNQWVRDELRGKDMTLVEYAQTIKRLGSYYCSEVCRVTQFKRKYQPREEMFVGSRL